MRVPRKASAIETTGQTEQGRSGIVALVLACLVSGFVAGAYWYYQAALRHRSAGSGKSEIRLSEGTMSLLRRLESPVEVRFYSLLSQEDVPASLRAFAERADKLLTAFEHAADGKITVTRHSDLSDAGIKAATSDGIRPFNLDKGDACFLGFTVAQDGQKETLRQLLPEWEQALESDLSRAIERVTSARAAATKVLPPSATQLAASEEVQRVLPNLSSLSVEEGTRILREAALKEFETAATEGEAQLQAAQERFAQTQPSQSEAERQAAREQFMKLQAAQTAKLKGITSRLQAEIAALERLKKAQPAAK